jgi:DNA-binding LytR/AlgR family response regulator
MSSQTLSRTTDGMTTANGKAKYHSVMLIDDNSLDNFINKKLIETHGFAEKVMTYQEATEALEILKTSPASDWPEVIFLDINMPEMDGFYATSTAPPITSPEAEPWNSNFLLFQGTLQGSTSQPSTF